MLDGRVAALRRRGVDLAPPTVVADSWFSDSKLMRHMATTHQVLSSAERRHLIMGIFAKVKPSSQGYQPRKTRIASA
jgi:hypothetical protein